MPTMNPAQAIQDLRGKVGDLSELDTVSKDNLVDAINEAASTGGGVQSDWDEDDTESMAYILNKPRIATMTVVEEEVLDIVGTDTTTISAENVNFDNTSTGLQSHNAQDAIEELDNSKISASYYTSTITTTWSGTAAPYTQTLTVNGILATDVPFVDLIASSSYSVASQEIQDYAKIYKMSVIGDNTITIYSTGTTQTPLNISLRCFR